MSDMPYSAEFTKTDHDPLRSVERKMVVLSLVFGVGLLTLLALLAHA